MSKQILLVFLSIICFNCQQKLDNSTQENETLSSTEITDSIQNVELDIYSQKLIPVVENTIEVSLQGEIQNLVKFGNNFYALISKENSVNSTSYSYSPIFSLAKISDKGIVKEIPIEPKFMQDFYYQFRMDNSNLYFVNTRDNDSYKLVNELFVSVGIRKENKVFEDKEYRIYTEDFGEWGGLTWIYQKSSKKEFEVRGYYPIIVRKENLIYLINDHTIYSISNFDQLKSAKVPYEKYLKDGMNIYNGNGTLDGVELVYSFEKYDYSEEFYIANAFTFKNQFYVLYMLDGISNVGIIENDKLVPQFELKNYSILPSQFNVLNPTSEKKSSVFSLNNSAIKGVIEFKTDKIEIYKIQNTYNQKVYNVKEINDWMKDQISIHSKQINQISIQEIVEKETQMDAMDITTEGGISKAMLEEFSSYDRRKLYRKKMITNNHLVSEYFYRSNDNLVGAISFTFDGKSVDFKNEFNFWIAYLKETYGNPTKEDVTEYRSIYYWDLTNEVGIRLEYNKNLSLSIYSN